MKVCIFPVRSILCLLILCVSTSLRAASDSDAELEAFRQKILAKEAERTKQVQPNESRSQFTVKVKQLQELLAKKDYDKAKQMLTQPDAFVIPYEFRDEWNKLISHLEETINIQQKESEGKWRVEIDQLVKDTKQGCLDAKSSADLDPLLERCADLQMRRVKTESNALSERTNRKLMGVAGTLSSWASYLDYKENGNAERARIALEQLKSNSTLFPVVTFQEINARIGENKPEIQSAHDIIDRVAKDMKSLADLPVALEKLKATAPNPDDTQFNSTLETECTRMTAVLNAWNAAKAGDVAPAQEVMSSGGLYSSEYYSPLMGQLVDLMIQQKGGTWSKLTMNPGEDSFAYLGRILDELAANGNYRAMVDVMMFASMLRSFPRMQAENWDFQSLRNYVAAEQFEKTGDYVAAVNNYRLVVGPFTGKYAPVEKAQEALKNLQQTHPEAFKSYEGLFLTELRGVESNLMMIRHKTESGGQPGGPFRGP